MHPILLSSFRRSLARAHLRPSPQEQVALLESVGFPQWGKAKSIISGGDLCLEEMAQALLVKGQEQVGEWGVVWARGWEEWEVIALEQDRAEAVFAPVAGPGFLMGQALPAIV